MRSSHPSIYQAWAYVPGLKLSAKVKHGDTAAKAASSLSWNVILFLHPPGINLRCLMYTWRHPKRIIINRKQSQMVWRIVLFSWRDNDCMMCIVKFLEEALAGCLLRCTCFYFHIINTDFHSLEIIQIGMAKACTSVSVFRASNNKLITFRYFTVKSN